MSELRQALQELVDWHRGGAVPPEADLWAAAEAALAQEAPASQSSRDAFDRIVVKAFADRHHPQIEDHWDTWQEAVDWAQSVNVAAQEHGRMPSASSSTGVGQTDDGALTSGPGMRARNAEGSMKEDDEVICPKCAHQFRAIPVNVQALLLASGHEPPFLSAQPPSADAVDAARYRWLRQHPEFLGWDSDYLPTAVDHHVDAAMGETHEQG